MMVSRIAHAIERFLSTEDAVEGICSGIQPLWICPSYLASTARLATGHSLDEEEATGFCHHEEHVASGDCSLSSDLCFITTEDSKGGIKAIKLKGGLF